VTPYCSSCGSPIPEGQGRSCSMCYGDPAYGRDGYYQDQLDQQQAQDEADRAEAELAEREVEEELSHMAEADGAAEQQQ
jgi:hypothetical protein